MSSEIKISKVKYSVKNRAKILNDINAHIDHGQFVALLGENGAGKTTLLDLVMGFRKPSEGKILVAGQDPHDDHWQQRKKIAYLSEKVDIPGDWSVREFLNFNKFFYQEYSKDLEQRLIEEFRVDDKNRLGNMSAGELRRVQVVGALSAKPQMVIIDEITAVLDIIGRRRFMKILGEKNREVGCTILMATNILEDLENYVSHIMLIRNGNLHLFQSLKDFLNGNEKNQFSQLVADHLEDK